MIESNLVQDIKALKTLPNSWTVKNFNEVVSDNSGGNKKLVKSKFLESGKIAIVDQGKEIIAGYFNDLNYSVKTNPPYIVFGDHTRIFKYIDFPFVMGADGTKVLQPIEENCSAKYLYYFFQSIKVPNTGYNRHFKYLKKLKIPLPPLPEQKRIAAILDAADALRQKDQQLIDHYNQLSQSLFLDMFGDPVTNPKGWKIANLESVCEKITDGTHHSPAPQKTGFPYVTAKHVKPHKLDFESNKTFISENAHKEIYSRCSPSKGDVLLIKDGATTGAACVNTFDQPISLLSSLALLKPSYEIKNQYLCYWLNHEGVKQKLMSQYMSGAAIRRYTLKKIKSFELMVPNIELQHKFTKYIIEQNRMVRLAETNLKKSNDLFNCLLQKAFTGELI